MSAKKIDDQLVIANVHICTATSLENGGIVSDFDKTTDIACNFAKIIKKILETDLCKIKNSNKDDYILISYHIILNEIKVMVYFDVEENQGDLFYGEFVSLSESLRVKIRELINGVDKLFNYRSKFIDDNIDVKVVLESSCSDSEELVSINDNGEIIVSDRAVLDVAGVLCKNTDKINESENKIFISGEEFGLPVSLNKIKSKKILNTGELIEARIEILGVFSDEKSFKFKIIGKKYKLRGKWSSREDYKLLLTTQLNEDIINVKLNQIIKSGLIDEKTDEYYLVEIIA